LRTKHFLHALDLCAAAIATVLVATAVVSSRADDFFTKNVDGRIDGKNAGWKGRGLWTTFGSRAVFHNEGGKEARPKVYKLQIRPDPLAR
jgi:hypothetical protein